MNDEQIRYNLHTVAEQHVPDEPNLWPAIRQRVQPRQTTKANRRFMPTTRLGWAAVVVFMFLAISSGAYAASTLVSQLFRTDPGLKYVDVTGLSQEINQSQTVDGVTVTLHRAYADAHRLVVSFIIQSSNGRHYFVYPTELVSIDNTPFVYTSAGGVNVLPETVDVPLAIPSGQTGVVYSFGAASINGSPAALNLRLTVQAEKQGDNEASPFNFIGPFVFDFSVPFTPGRVVDVEQTKQVDGRAATLKQVTVAPSGTQTVVCFDPAPEGTDWTINAEIQLNGGQRIGWTGANALDMAGCHSIDFYDAFADKSGAWTLSVSTLEGTTNPSTMRTVGPWTFRFTVPQP